MTDPRISRTTRRHRPMKASFGHGGWVAIDGVDLPGPLYVRMRESDGRLRISELYLDASAGPDAIDATDLRELPLTAIESFINQDRDFVMRSLDIPSPDLSTLASYYASGLGSDPDREIEALNWVVISLASQFDRDVLDRNGLGHLHPVKRAPDLWPSPRRPERGYRLPSGPVKDGLTDRFLANVARAYAAAVARGERPNVAMAAQTGYPIRSVERWVYTARQRGIMPRGRRGRQG